METTLLNPQELVTSPTWRDAPGSLNPLRGRLALTQEAVLGSPGISFPLLCGGLNFVDSPPHTLTQNHLLSTMPCTVIKPSQPLCSTS